MTTKRTKSRKSSSSSSKRRHIKKSKIVSSFEDASVPYLTIHGAPSGYDVQSDRYHDTIVHLWHTTIARKPILGTTAADGDDEAVQREWYDKSAGYWREQSADVSGMLGGFDCMHADDIRESRALITSMFPHCTAQNTLRALDCGAGIGRITKHLLCGLCGGGVDLMDTVDIFVERARTYVDNDNLRETFVCSMQDFVPSKAQYDIIWVQWCVMYLTDRDLIDFLKRCTGGLKPGGVIVVKDNITRSNTGFVFDSSDNSFVRSAPHFEAVFAHAGLRVREERDQIKLPENVMRVRMWALEPQAVDTPAVDQQS